jgi:hypothetical protein
LCKIEFQKNHSPGYLKAVWPEFLGMFLRSGRPRGIGLAFKNAPGTAGLPVPQGFPWINLQNPFAQHVHIYWAPEGNLVQNTGFPFKPYISNLLLPLGCLSANSLEGPSGLRFGKGGDHGPLRERERERETRERRERASLGSCALSRWADGPLVWMCLAGPPRPSVFKF